MTDPHDFEAAILKPLELVLAICLATMVKATNNGNLQVLLEEDKEGEELVAYSVDSVCALAEAAATVYAMRKDIEKSEKEFE